MIATGETLPQFTVVSAVYNVARYLPDFISSIENQTFDLNRVEVIMVDDGSTDESAQVLAAWQARSPQLVKVLTKENGGQGSARNLGIEHATGDWITFTDPDDFLADEALTEVAAFMASSDPNVAFFVSNLIVYQEDRGELLNNHPLRARFAGGNQVVDLNRFPNYFHLHAASGYFRRSVLLEEGICFDDRVKPVFEDAHFVAHYLLGCNPPLVGFVASSEYRYRRRSDQSSTLQTASTRPERFTAVNRYGLLDVLRAGKRLHGTIPVWLQNTVIYDLNWVIRSEEVLSGAMRAIDHGVEDEFHDLMDQVTGLLQRSVVEHFDLLRLPESRVVFLAHAYRGVPWHEEGALMNRFDDKQGLVRLTYYYVGAPPVETLRFRGRVVEPVHAKHRDLIYSGRALIHQRILWARADGSLLLQLNGEPVPLWRHRPRHKATWRPADIQKAFGGPMKVARVGTRSALLESGRQVGQAMNRMSRSGAAKERRLVERLRRDSRLQDAWLLMDRDINANDNAEHLFRHLRRNRPDINAWFTVSKDSEAFSRLKGEGLGNVVVHGSPEWIALSLTARHLISSHVDEYVVRPQAVMEHGTPTSQFSFLQHGVTHNDLSAWLNTKRIQLMVTSSRPEYDAIAGNGSPYALTTREVALTGFPRHDRLVVLGASVAPEKRRSILVMPTWRQFLVGQDKPGSGGREAMADFQATQFAREWSGLLRSPRLEALARDSGSDIVFMPHPNLEPYLGGFGLPARIGVSSYEDSDVQQRLADARVVITDYSSVVFDAAIIDRPIMYFQFDRARVFGGGHLTRPGYFSYDRDGFGPVATTSDEAITALESVVADGLLPRDVYLDRIGRTFPLRDSESSARVTDAILRLTKRSRKPVATPAAPPILHWG